MHNNGYQPLPTTDGTPEDTDAAGDAPQIAGNVSQAPLTQNASVAAARAVIILMKREDYGSLSIPVDSVYGVAVAMPQIARSSGWSVTLLALAIRSYIHLFLNLMVQVVLLYQVELENNVMNLYGGQMHVCNFGSSFDQCPGRADCTGPGGTSYTRDNLYANFQQWSTRMFIKDAFLRILPERQDRINQVIVPGEFGLESPICRMLCIFIFVLYIADDFRETLGLASLMWHIPSRPESWLAYEPPQCEGMTKEDIKTILQQHEFDFVRFRIRGMPLPWKAANVCFVALPKLFIWLLLLQAGTQFLMDTAGIQDLITNSLAMAFVLSLDELIASRLCTEATKSIMEKLEPYDLYDPGEDGGVDDATVMEAFRNFEERFQITEIKLFLLLLPRRLLIIVAIAVAAYLWYFRRFCDTLPDDSSISKPLFPPVQIQKIGSWLFQWCLAGWTIERVPTPSWSMPSTVAAPSTGP